MKAIRIHDYGEADALIYEDASIPEPPPDGVLIKVHAAGVNPVDWKIRKGLMRATRPLQFPAIMGSDIAGTVALAGPLVTRLKEGDPVIARIKPLRTFQSTGLTPAACTLINTPSGGGSGIGASS